MRLRIATIVLPAILGVSGTAGQTIPSGSLPVGPGRISGVVMLADSSRPLGSAAITVRNAADSVVVTGGLSGDDGKFRIEGLPPGRYLVRVSLIGHEARNLPVVAITPAAVTVDVGVIALPVVAVSLPDVEVTAERATVVLEADRTVYNTKDLPAAAGTTMDVLRSVPELEVDVNGRVMLRGNQSVAIHLNGRPAPLRGDQLTNFLQQLPGNRVAKVEVMPNPSAKHDPEGMGGIVNVVLKENADLGLSGSLTLNGSTRLTRGVGGRLNYQKGRLTLFTGAGVNWSDSEANAIDVRENRLAQPVTYMEQSTHRVFNGLFGNFDLTAEFKLGQRSTLWTSVWWYGSESDNEQQSAYRILDHAQVAQDRYDRGTTGGTQSGNGDATVGFKHVFQPQRHELTVDLRISSGINDADSEWTREYLMSGGQPVDWPDEHMLNDVDGDLSNLSLQADYFRPLGGRGRLDVGYRAWQRGESNDNRVDMLGAPPQSLTLQSTLAAYDHDETFHSLYTTLAQTYGKVGVQVGVRAELATTTFGVPTRQEQFDNDYNSIFPSANLSYNFGQGRSARLSYSKRIGRPYPFILNPYIPSTDPLNNYAGNPDIRPTYTHSLNLDLSWVGQKGTLRAAPYYRRTVDNWDQIRLVDEQGVSTMTWRNVASLEVLGSSFTASLRPTGRLNGALSFVLFHESRDASNLSDDYSRRSWRWSASLNSGYRLNNALTANTNLRYAPPFTLIQGRSSGMFYSTVGLRQQVWGTRGSIGLLLNDPFDLYRFNFTTSDRTHVQSSRTTLKQRMATLSFTYNFGRPPEQASRRQADEAAAPGTIIR